MSASQDDVSATVTPATIPDETEPTNPQATTTATSPVNKEQEPEPQDSNPKKPKPEPQRCGVCGEGAGKYKCPRCPLAYCSVACNKIHKTNHPPDEPSKPPQPPPPSTTKPTPQNNSKDPYEVLLQHRYELDRLFRKYPGLQRVLVDIQDRTLPPPDNPSTSAGGVPAKVLQQTGGVSGAGIDDRYGGGGGTKGRPQPHQQIWTREVGLRRGAEALRKARTDPGNNGDGVREFCEVVMHLLSLPPAADNGGGVKPDGLNVTSLVREEVVAEQAKVIEQLLEAERDD